MIAWSDPVVDVVRPRRSTVVCDMYLLTPAGINEKARITASFLKRKLNEYEKIKQEIESLRKEVETN